MKHTPIGQLRHKIDIVRKKQGATNDRGKIAYSDEVLFSSVPAKVRKLRGGEVEKVRHIFSEAEYEITLRYRAGITRKMFCKFGDREFYIGDVNNIDERNQWLVLTCKEVD